MDAHQTIYIVKMNRWGDPEQHSYVLGAFTSKQYAQYAVKDEHEYRGGKYDGEIIETALDVYRGHDQAPAANSGSESDGELGH